MEWTVTEAETAGEWRIAAAGDCDLYEAPRFAADMLALIEAGARRLTLDFGAVAYLDSTGVGAIIRILQAARGRGAALRFRGIAGSPRRVLEMSGVLRVMLELERPR